jgi:hypothetical protein
MFKFYKIITTEKVRYNSAVVYHEPKLNGLRIWSIQDLKNDKQQILIFFCNNEQHTENKKLNSVETLTYNQVNEFLTQFQTESLIKSNTLNNCNNLPDSIYDLNEIIMQFTSSSGIGTHLLLCLLKIKTNDKNIQGQNL